MKSYTDLEQSKKLLEILPPNIADMYYSYVFPKSHVLQHVPNIGNPVRSLECFNKGYTMSGKDPVTLNEYCIPCWSTDALADIIKTYCTQFDTTLLDNKNYYVFIVCGNDDYHAYIKFTDTKPKGFTNLTDAYVEVIIKLHENNVL